MRFDPRPDGRTNVFVRQSWLKTFFDCPESARRTMVEQPAWTDSDSTVVGTAVHTGIEHHVEHDDFSAALCAALDDFDAAVEKGGINWVKSKKPATARDHVAHALARWHRDVWPQVGLVTHIEEQFEVVLYEDTEHVVHLTGTMDAVTEDGQVWDWKTFSSPRKWTTEKWQLRWDVQSSFYTYGAHHHLSVPDPTFFFAAVPRTGSTPAVVIESERGPAEWAWLRHQIESIVPMVAADLPQWPLRDQHALCSATWCEWWTTCKGAALAGVPVTIG